MEVFFSFFVLWSVFGGSLSSWKAFSFNNFCVVFCCLVGSYKEFKFKSKVLETYNVQRRPREVMFVCFSC